MTLPALFAAAAKPLRVGVLVAAASLMAQALQAADPRRVAYRFERASVAYDTMPAGSVELLPHDPIFRTVLSMSPSDGHYRYDGGGAGQHIAPRGGNSRFIFGVGYSNGMLYRSVDGDVWEPVSSEYASELFGLQDGTLILTRFEGEHTIALRSEDDGVTWTPCLRAEDGQPFRLDTPLAWIVPFGRNQAANGTVLMGEYILPNHCRNLYRSADSGRTWQRVYDNGGKTTFNHFHCVVKQEALGRWIAVTGDTPERNKLLASDDDGITWFEYNPYGLRTFQPTYLLDYGHPERLLFGADDVYQMGWVDVSDGPDARKIEPLIFSWDSRPAMNYSFLLFEHEGTHFACNTQLSQYTRNAVLSISPDLEHWGVYHSFQSGETGIMNQMGERGGFLHTAVATANQGIRHFALSPPQTALRRGVLVQAPTVNLLDSPALSSGETLDGWENISVNDPNGAGNGVLECVDGMAHSGVGSVRFERTDGGVMHLLSPTVQMETAFKRYHGRFWIRGKGGTCTAMWLVNGQPAGAIVMFGLSEDKWRQVILPPVMATQAGSSLRMFIGQDSAGGGRCEAFVDSLQIDANPGGPWQQGGAPRAATRLRGQVAAGDAWTNIFTIVPERIWAFLGEDQYLSVKTWVRDEHNYLSLSYLSNYGMFILEVVENGELVEEVGIGLNAFQQDAQIRIAVGASDEGISVTVANGTPQPSIFLPAASFLLHGPLELRYGVPPTGQHTLGFVVHDDVMYEEHLDRPAIDVAMRNLTPPHCAGDLDGDGRVQQADLALLLSCYNLGPCGDVTGDGQTDQSDLAALLANYQAVCP